MAYLRRSTHANLSKITFNDNDLSPSYPDSPPSTDFEKKVASLDQQSFPWKELSVVDDILVYSLFSSKRRMKRYTAIKTEQAFGEKDMAVTVEVGLLIRKIIQEYLPVQGVRNTGDAGNAAQALIESLPDTFSQEQLGIIKQYAVSFS